MSNVPPSRLPAYISTKLFFIICILSGSIFPLQLVPSAERHHPGADGQFSGKQGQVLWIEIPISDPAAKVVGTFLKQKIPFFPLNSNSVAGLVGLDMQAEVGLQELSVDIRSQHKTEHQSYTVLIMKEDYDVQHLTLPKNKVDLDAKTLKRVRQEQKELAEVFHEVSSTPLWDGPFLEPASGRITGVFGSRRVINGQPRRPHTGEDIAAPKGTPIQTINRGKVVITVDHFFSGKGVVVDHGLGLFSMYFHLSEIDVQTDQFVNKGDLLGKVGSSGRATGPHLHWGIRLNGSRVNPYELMNLPIQNETE